MTKTLFKTIESCSGKEILKTLCTLATSEGMAAYATDHFYPMKGLSRMYVLMDRRRNFVIAMQDDLYPHLDELADEDFFNTNELPLYFNEENYRVSPVYILYLAKDCFQKFIRQKYAKANVKAVLLTKSRFINYDDLEEKWKSMDVRVFDSLKYQGNCLKGIRKDPTLEKLVEDFNLFMASLNPTLPYCMMWEKSARKIVAPRSKEKEAKEGQENASAQGAANAPVIDVKNLLIDFKESEECTAQSGTVLVSDDEPEGTPVGAQPGENLPPYKFFPYQSDAKERLKKLEGLREIKKSINELIMLTRYNSELKKLRPEAQTHALSHHALFLGNPGTGKTTVGQIYASLLHDAGVLSKGHCIAVSRSSFIGNRWGDEEKNMSKLLEMAQGGVLFIDEAYLLCSPHPQDPGRIAIQLLLDVLADEKNRDIAVVLAGYEEPMNTLLELNPGLESRFPGRNRFIFSDFTVDELLLITKSRLQAYGYSFTAKAWASYKLMLQQAYDQRDRKNWGNARFVQNFLESIYCNHAVRCMDHGLTGSKMLSLTSQDLKDLTMPEQKHTSPRAMGFR